MITELGLNMTTDYSPPEINDHLLQDGVIEILSVIDVFTYSVRCQDCLSLEEINLELKRIIPECISLKSDNVNKINSLVIVEESDGKYFRGYLKYREEKNVFHVSLIDVGDDLCIQPRNIYYLPEGLLKLKAQRHTIKLYGIIPSPEITCSQLNDCYIVLLDLIRNSTNTTLKEFYEIDCFYYGTIEIVTFYNNNLCNFSLKNILLEKRIALPSDNFLKDIRAKSKQESIPEQGFFDKVGRGVGNIEITPQHSLYLNALTSGLLINPESFACHLLKTETTSEWFAMAVENKFDGNRKREDHEMAKLEQHPGIGHGRLQPPSLIQSGQSMGRGKIKSLLQNLSDMKTTLDNQVHSQDSISKSVVPENAISEKPESVTKINHFEFKSDIEITDGNKFNQVEKVDSNNLIYNTNKNSMSEELCIQLLKGKNKKSNSDARNRKSKHKLKSHSFQDVPISFHSREHNDEQIFTQNQNDQLPVNPFKLESCAFSSLNKTSPMKKEPDQREYEDYPPKSLAHENIIKVDTKSKLSTEKREKSEFSFESPNSLAFHKESSPIVNSPVMNKEKSLKTEGNIKSMGRGFLLNKFNELQKVNHGLISTSKSPETRNVLPIDKKSENIKNSPDHTSLDIDKKSKNSPKSCDGNDSRTESKLENFNKYHEYYDFSVGSNPESSKKNYDSPKQSNLEALKKSKDETDNNDFKDDDDHEDRYFEIEEPTYLNCSSDFTFLENKTGNKQKVTKSDDERYEKLLNSAPNSEHEPLDDKPFVNPPAQVKPEVDLLEQQILRDYSIGQIPERMKMSCGLIHGNIVANPVSKLSDLKLEQHVFSNLNAKNMRELSRSQMFAVPVLLQRRNLVLIGPPNSGKTLAFVMSFLSLLHDDEYYSSLKPGNGPRCVFVSSCAQNVNYISQFCSAICGAKLTIITTHGGGLELERKEDLTNGCEILVTTPRCLLRLLKHTSVTNLFRVCHIVFDDVDTLLSIFCPEVQEIMNNLNKMLQIRKRYSNIGIQVVLVGEKWTPIIEDITFKALDSPVLCITAHLEAALYARIKPKTYILSPDSKIKKLKELLDCISKKIRTVIVCRSADEVKLLRPLLELTLSDVLVAHEEMGLNQLIEVGDLWIRCTSPPILLCSDPVLNELAVTNAQWLIHFSMPDNKSSFSERFSTIKEHLYDRIKYPKTAPPECQVHILVDDTNELQFPEIISFMKRLNTSIPDVFLEAVKKISILKEEKKIDVPFCENLLMFGNCWRKDKCKRQHIFNKSRDTPEDLPVKGIMKVKLLYAHNPSHYSVRILAIKNSDKNDEEWIDFPSNYALIAFKMSNYFSFRENRFAHGRVKIGDLVAIEVEPDLMFKRAKVIDIVTRDDKYNPREVMVHFIDEGSVDKLMASQLLHLPSEFQIYSQEAYDLYLLGLQPVDYDKSWSFASTLKIQKSISNLNFQEGDNKFFTANITLVAGKNLLATSFLCYEWLDLNKCHVVLFSPKKFILDTGLAEPNPKHFSTLMNLALDAGLISCIPEDIKKSTPDEDIEKVQWAHLDKENTNFVHVISSDSPSMFFLKLFKFSDRLQLLEKELSSLLDSKPTKFETLEYDMICAAKNPNDNKWNRAMVNNVTKDEVEVFFVDYGDCLVLPLANISRLPKGFVSRLPFQAIECSLIGIKPLDDDWLPQAVEAFDSMCSNEERKLIPMFAKVCEVTGATITTGHHFKVVLAPSTDQKAAYVNKEMVYRGFANWDVQTKHYLTEEIIWSEGTVDDDDEWDYDEDLNSYKEENQDNNIVSDNTQLQTTESEAGTSSGKNENGLDILSILKNGDFDLGNTQFLMSLLPPAIQERWKEKNIDQALTELKEKRNEEKKKTLKQISYGPKDDDLETSDIVEGPLLESCGLYHPEVYWSQRDCHVRIKINLADIEKYQLDYSDQVLIFRAFANEKYYWFEIVLFGQIIKEKVSYASRGLYFDIKMEKFIKGEFWPRLVFDDFKFPWIKLDPDFIEQDDLSLIESMFKRGMKFRQPHTFDEDPDFASTGVPEPDSDLESGSSRSDNEEFTDLVHDTIDPESD